MHCPACGHENKADLRFCVNCGEKLSEHTEGKKFCPNCGKQNLVEARFCEDCGSEILSPVNSVKAVDSEALSPALHRSRSFVWLWSLLGLGLVFLITWLVYAYWLPGPALPAQSQVFPSSEPATQATPFICTAQNAFYFEDFKEIQTQDWTNIQQFASMIEIASTPDDPGNSVLFIRKPTGTSGQVQASTELNVPAFSNAYLSVRFYMKGAMPAGDANWFSFNWLHSPSPILVDGKEVYDSRYQLPIGYNYFEMRRLQQPLTNESVDRSPSFPLSGKWYELEIATYDAYTEVWLDDVLVMDYQDPHPLPEGTLGLEVWLDDPTIGLIFDDITICELSAPYVPAAP